MKRTIIILAAAIFCSGPLFAQGSELEDIISKNLFARYGGAERAGYNFAYAEGAIKGKGMDGFFRIWHKKPGKVRHELIIKGETITTIVNGEKGWVINPSTGEYIPLDSAKAQNAKKEILSQFLFYQSPFLKYTEEGYNAQYTGQGLFEGDTVDIIKLHKPGEADLFVYVHHKTKVDYQLYFGSDFKKQEKGAQVFLRKNRPEGKWILPHLIQIYSKGELRTELYFNKIEIDKEIPDRYFNYIRPGIKPEKIIEEYYRAVGIIGDFENLKNYKASGSLTGGRIFDTLKTSVPVDLAIEFPDRARLQMEESGTLKTTIANGGEAWAYEGAPEESAPMRLDESSEQLFLSQILKYFLLVETRILTNEVDSLILISQLSEAGRDYYSVKAQSGEKNIFYFFDIESGLLAKTAESMRGHQSYMMKYYYDYMRKGGFILPTYVKTRLSLVETEFRVEDIKVNAELEPDLFSLPN